MSLPGVLLMCLSALAPCQGQDAPAFSVLQRAGVTVHYSPGDSLRAERVLGLLEGFAGLPGIPLASPARPASTWRRPRPPSRRWQAAPSPNGARGSPFPLPAPSSCPFSRATARVAGARRA